MLHVTQLLGGNRQPRCARAHTRASELALAASHPRGLEGLLEVSGMLW